MDPVISAQDVVRCSLCKTTVAPMHCENCYINLCKDCIVNHISDSSKFHNMVPLKYRGPTLIYPKCPTHTTKQCEFHCEQCDIPICLQCAFSGLHKGHNCIDLLKKLKLKKGSIQTDLQELKSICSKYQDIASFIPFEKAELKKNSKKLVTAICKHGEDLHKEIDTVIKSMTSNLDEMDSKHLAVLQTQEDEITWKISEITQIITNLTNILDSNDVGLISKYKCRNEEFTRLPSMIKVTLPKFSPNEVNRDQIHQQIGSLSAMSFTREEVQIDTTLGHQEKCLTPPTINTRCRKLHRVACLEDKIWTSSDDNILRLYNLRSEEENFVQTASGNRPDDIAVTEKGHLVYIDSNDRTVNIVKGTQLRRVNRPRGWIPMGVCSSRSGGVLVIMVDDDSTETKLFRYHGLSKEKSFSIPGLDCYSHGCMKPCSENRNRDICVVDYAANAVVVVNQAGDLRFTYTGPPSTAKESFRPLDITTDSQSQILTVDGSLQRIHILDQDGQFLGYIDKCDLRGPCSLCVDTNDNLFVAESDTGKVKKIEQHFKSTN